MSAPERSARAGARRSLRGGPVLPLVGVCAGVVALSAAVTLGGGDSSDSPSAGTDTASTASAPATLPAANTCALREGKVEESLSVAAARTLTQIAAVGWQVKAPAEMTARVLDLATAKPGPTPTTTQALDLFTREDSQAPSAQSLAAVTALAQPGALTCVFSPQAVTAEKKGKSGLTPRADALRQGVTDAFGKLTISGYGPKLKSTIPAETAGRALAVAVPTLAATAAPTGGDPGWVLAHWLTARGADYKLDLVAYGDHAWAPTSGWQTTPAGAPTVAPVSTTSVFVSVVPGTPAPKTSHKASKKKH
jgi:hypothetical protein